MHPTPSKAYADMASSIAPIQWRITIGGETITDMAGSPTNRSSATNSSNGRATEALQLDSTHQLRFRHFAISLPALKANPTIAMTAIRSNVRAMRFVSSELRDNRAVILLASDLDGTFERASPKLCTERTFVLAVLKRRRQFPFADMKFISPQLRADRDVASAMVKCAMNAMQSVSLDLRADRSFVVQAIRHACGEVPPVRGHRRRPARHLPPHEPWRGMGAAREGRARTPKRGAN